MCQAAAKRCLPICVVIMFMLAAIPTMAAFSRAKSELMVTTRLQHLSSTTLSLRSVGVSPGASDRIRTVERHSETVGITCGLRVLDEDFADFLSETLATSDLYFIMHP